MFQRFRMPLHFWRLVSTHAMDSCASCFCPPYCLTASLLCCVRKSCSHSSFILMCSRRYTETFFLSKIQVDRFYELCIFSFHMFDRRWHWRHMYLQTTDCLSWFLLAKNKCSRCHKFLFHFAMLCKTFEWLQYTCGSNLSSALFVCKDCALHQPGNTNVC